MDFKICYVIFVCLRISVVLSSTTDSSGKRYNITDELETLKSTVTILSTKLNKTEIQLGTLERVLGRRIMGEQQVEGQVTQINHISFSAYKNQTHSGVSNRHIIKFEKTILNLGNHYHPEDGIFIAPVSGVYLFHCTIISYSAYLYVNIMVGGNVVTTTTAGSASGAFNAGSAMVIVNVKKEQHVWIQTCCGSANYIKGNTLGLDNSFQSTFSGTLLQETNA